MKDLVQTRRTRDDMIADIAAERVAHGATIDAFHRAFYASRQTHGMTFFEGVPILKNPMDMWVYQDLIWDLKPTLIIETGTAYGGSALWFARQLDKLGAGNVVSIDLEPHERLPVHSRISYVKHLSSVDPRVIETVETVASGHPRTMVVLDSDHSARHVTDELDAYSRVVSVNQFLVVEDTNINGRPVEIDWKGGPGPGPAVDAWLPDHPEFVVDPLASRYFMTFHTWLRRSH